MYHQLKDDIFIGKSFVSPLDVLTLDDVHHTCSQSIRNKQQKEKAV